MSGRVTRRATIASLVRRELLVYSRDRLYLFLTALTLVFVAVVLWIAPSEVDDQLTLAVSPPLMSLTAGGVEISHGMVSSEHSGVFPASVPIWGDGLRIIEFQSETELRAALHGDLEVWLTEDGGHRLRVAEGREAPQEGSRRLHLLIGVAFPQDLIVSLAAGDRDVVVRVYAHASVPPEVRAALGALVRELAHQLTGREPPVSFPAEEAILIGPGRADGPLSWREKLIPIIVFVMLLMETLSLSSLISSEVRERTVTAVLVTPARVSDVLLAKTAFGTSLAVAQVLPVLALGGAFTGQNWLVLVVCVLVGALMFTGVAMVVGAAGKDFIGQLFYTMLITVPLIIPALALLFPGAAAAWVQVLPTHFLLDALLKATVHGAAWSDLWLPLGISSGWVVALYGVGVLALGKRVVSL